MTNISMKDLSELIEKQITPQSIDFGLNCNLEDPSEDERVGFETGVRYAIWVLKKGVDPKYGD